MLHFKKVHNKGMQFPWHPGRRQFPDRKAILYTTLFEEKKAFQITKSYCNDDLANCFRTILVLHGLQDLEDLLRINIINVMFTFTATKLKSSLV